MRPHNNSIARLMHAMEPRSPFLTHVKGAIMLKAPGGEGCRLGLCLLVLGLMLGLQGCLPGQCVTFPTNYEGDYHGQIISAGSGEPLEGVVIVGAWDKLVAQHVAGSQTEFYDARETITNANGEFTLRGRGFTLFTPLEGMRLLVFKAGYEYFDYPWRTYKYGERINNPARFEGEKLILPSATPGRS